MDNYNYNNESDSVFFNIKNTINYVIENREKFVLLVLVFVIVYFVDYITYINGMMYGVTSPPGLPSLKTSIHHIKKQSKRRRV
jgi:hypothetical protein